MQQTNDQRLKWVDRVSRLMDSKFTIPGTNVRFGLDPIFSIVPVAGDVSTFIVSVVLISTMYKHGASGRLVVQMMLNALLDMVVGSIPVLGTIFDVWFKANNRNVQLLRKYYEEQDKKGKH